MNHQAAKGRPRKRHLLALLLVVALAAGACGRGSDSTPKAGDSTGDSAGTGLPPVAVPGFDGTTIKLGALTPLTTTAALIGKPLNEGMRTWFEQLNAKGGVAGKYKVELVTQDTKYDAPTAVQQYDSIKGGVVMIAQAFGTPIVNALLPKLKADNIVAQPASLDSFWVREQQLLPVGSPYQIEAINALDYYLANGGKGKKLCVLAVDDPYGEAGLAGFTFAAGKLSVTTTLVSRFTSGTTDFTAQVNSLKQAGCEMVFGVFTAIELSGIMTAATTLSFAPQWIGQAPSWLSIFANTALKDYLVAHFWVASEGPAWGDPAVPAMAELEKARQTYATTQAPDQYYLYGYVAAQAVTAVLEKAVARGDLSRAGIVTAMNSLSKLSSGGLLGDYGWGKPADRNPARRTTIFKVDPAKPYALAIVVQDHRSDAADAFKF
jgi:ABC-type branched-subunit amino acid transport system substrate-binding protein